MTEQLSEEEAYRKLRKEYDEVCNRFDEYEEKQYQLGLEKDARIASLESQLRQGHGDTWDAAYHAFYKVFLHPERFIGHHERTAWEKMKTEYLNKLFPQITDEQAKELMKPDYSELMKPQSMRKCPICGHRKCLCNVSTI